MSERSSKREKGMGKTIAEMTRLIHPRRKTLEKQWEERGEKELHTFSR